MRPEPIHIIILLVVILLVFGAPKLPMIAKNVGKSLKIFKSEIKDLRDDDSERDPERHQITDAADPAERYRAAPGAYDSRGTGPESSDAAGSRNPVQAPTPGDEHRPHS